MEKELFIFSPFFGLSRLTTAGSMPYLRKYEGSNSQEYNCSTKYRGNVLHASPYALK
jgi:hypothetical protein